MGESDPRDEREIMEVLLKNREIEDAEGFFNPPDPKEILADLPRFIPDLNLKDLKRAVSRIKKAVRGREKIIVWGDYDVDGISATAILWRVLWDLGADVRPYIPDRFEEGYGLNKEGIGALKEKGVSLIVTVDSGITAKEAVDHAASLGVDMIISDHHLKPRALPKAHAIVHTTRLCGTGVAWILASQLASPVKVQKELDLVAIATIADLQPVLGANRALMKRGFEVLNRLERPGLAALAEVSRLKRGALSSYAAGWVLGPRINAVGRMGQGIEALRLLCTPKPTRARELAHILGKANQERKDVTEEIVEDARRKVNKKGLIVVYEDGWHEGVIGLVASKLVGEFARPAVVISKGDGFSKGSARSVNGLNIVEILKKYDRYLEDLGGHEAAAGFTIKSENLEPFVKALSSGTEELISRLDPRPVLKIDARLPLDKLTYEIVRELEKFEPTGLGNAAPLFLAEGAKVISTRMVGKDSQHLILRFAPGFEAIWFGAAGEEEFSRGETISFVYSPEIRTYRGKESLSLRIEDLRRFK